MSTDFYLYSPRTNSCVYIGYSWGAGMHEKTIADRRLVADWIADHVGEVVRVSVEPLGRQVDRDAWSVCDCYTQRAFRKDRIIGGDLGGVACEICGHTLADHRRGEPCSGPVKPL